MSQAVANPENVRTFMHLVHDAGPIVIAAFVLSVIMVGVWRLIVNPLISSNEETARQHAEAAKNYALASTANSDAIRAAQAASEANATTAAHLSRITDLLLNKAAGGGL